MGLLPEMILTTAQPKKPPLSLKKLNFFHEIKKISETRGTLST
jgi:hypothetical protein